MGGQISNTNSHGRCHSGVQGLYQLTYFMPLPQIEDGHSPGCYRVHLSYTSNWEQKFLLISDVHFDAMGCNRDLFRKHLEQAKSMDAPVCIFGDLLDLIQGKADPRGSKHQLRPEYAGSDDYLGRVCEDAADFLEPYAENIALIGLGNHEFEYRRRHEIDPLTIVAMHLQNKTGHRPIVAPYTGWIQFKLRYAGGAQQQGISMKFHHGVGGNSPVTRGAIQSNRSAVMWPGANIIIRGHIHHRFQMSMPVELVTTRGRLITDQERVYLQSGCYVSDVQDPDSWSSRRGFGAPAMGGWWLRLYCDKMLGTKGTNVRYQALPTD